MAMTFKILPAATLLALLGASPLLLTACGGGESPAAAPDAQASPMTVTVATAQLRSVADAVRLPGSVLPWARISPGTKILGRVERVEVREGDAVTKGQRLAKLESRDLEAAVAQAQSAVAMAEAQLENARAQHQRMVELSGRGAVTAKSLEDAVATFRVAEASRAQAQASVTAARVQLSYAEVHSPSAGWVVAKTIEPGDMAAPGAPLFTIEDLRRVKIEVQVPEQDLAGLAVGGAAQVEILGETRQGTIDRIAPAGDPASRTFTLQVVLDNPDGRLKSGMFARVVFAKGQVERLSVPQNALVRRGQLVGIYIVQDGRARLRWIKTGREATSAESADLAGEVEVLSGLEAGETYVLPPPPGLTDGSPVRAEARS